MGAIVKYTQAFKRQAVDMVRDGRTELEVAKQLGITDRTLRRWLRRTEADEAMEAAVKGGAIPMSQLELAKLRKEIGHLKEANQALQETVNFLVSRRRK